MATCTQESLDLEIKDVGSLVPRPFDGEEKGPGTHCLRMRQPFRKNVRKGVRTLILTM
jgi:hypothetical protein